uniref:Uncharacterized protein n=1 Tax=Picea glauca TaxID=3330 RepID=A0A101M549_PICGL|nr:hypothetical protein ABT39_MTgene1118 [Picea glauca]
MIHYCTCNMWPIGTLDGRELNPYLHRYSYSQCNMDPSRIIECSHQRDKSSHQMKQSPLSDRPLIKKAPIVPKHG